MLRQDTRFRIKKLLKSVLFRLSLTVAVTQLASVFMERLWVNQKTNMRVRSNATI